MAEDTNKLIEERKNKLSELNGIGINPYPYAYTKTNNANELLEKYKGLASEEHTKDQEVLLEESCS